MGRKSKKEYVFEESGTGDAADDDANFAARLLAGMGIEQSKHEKADEGVEYADDGPPRSATGTPNGEIRHPHLHHLHESLHKVLHPHRSGTSSPASPATASPRTASPVAASPTTASSSAGSSTPGDAQASATSADVPAGKRRNRRKEKLHQREVERAKIVAEAEAEAKTVPDKRAIELKGMGMMITKAGLVEHEVQPDGHCLFHSLSDQLALRRSTQISAQELRSALADYIRQHPDDFVPYLIEDESGDVIDIEQYTSDLENTAMWGGSCEIMAASRLYEAPISVHFATHAPLTINEETYPTSEVFHLAFYEQKFGLGAHYNSLRDAPKGTRAYGYRLEIEGEDDADGEWKQH